MAYLIINKDHDEEGVRQDMRRSMRGNYRYDGTKPMMRHGGDTWEHGYRMGYRHGWEDCDEEEAEYRRSRDSRGRFV